MFIFTEPMHNTIQMADYQGFCLKCKNYGPISGPEMHTMKNGRKRVAGTCSKDGCTGKISKIIA